MRDVFTVTAKGKQMNTRHLVVDTGVLGPIALVASGTAVTDAAGDEFQQSALLEEPAEVGAGRQF